MKITDLYESEFLTDKDEIINYLDRVCTNFNQENLKIESDGLVYNGGVSVIANIDTPKLKVQFKEVTGYFDFYKTIISSLEGCPQKIGEYFDCGGTNIDSLKFFPKSVVDDFYCHDIKITDPKEYRYALYCEIGGEFKSSIDQIDEIINSYGGPTNRKHWPHAINLLSKVKL